MVEHRVQRPHPVPGDVHDPRPRLLQPGRDPLGLLDAGRRQRIQRFGHGLGRGARFAVPPAVGLRLPTMASCGSCQRRCITAHEQHGRRVGRAPQQIRIGSRRAGQQRAARPQPAQVGRDARFIRAQQRRMVAGVQAELRQRLRLRIFEELRDPGSRPRSAASAVASRPGARAASTDAGTGLGSWRFIVPA